MENKFFDPVFWAGLGALFASLIWLMIGIIWSMIRKSKWIEIGRQLEREKKSDFKKTSGTRRATSADTRDSSYYGVDFALKTVAKPKQKKGKKL